MNNPFKQSAGTWLVKTTMPFKHIGVFDSHFENLALSVAYFEQHATPRFESEPDDLWIFEAYFDHKPEKSILLEEFKIAANVANYEIIDFTIEEIIDKDWVQEVQKTFTPFIVNDFYIHSSDYPKSDDVSKYDIVIDAARAFGTGEHQTTKGCLSAISFLHDKGNKFKNMLDMGCGTGILAIAMAKVWETCVLAVDIDPIAVQIAIDNALINNVLNYLDFTISNGYNFELVNKKLRYDLITSNILAGPLIEFAPMLASNLIEGGYAILSGLLSYQEDDVINAHVQSGLKLVNTMRIDDWSTLVIQK